MPCTLTSTFKVREATASSNSCEAHARGQRGQQAATSTHTALGKDIWAASVVAVLSRASPSPPRLALAKTTILISSPTLLNSFFLMSYRPPRQSLVFSRSMLCPYMHAFIYSCMDPISFVGAIDKKEISFHRSNDATQFLGSEEQARTLIRIALMECDQQGTISFPR